MFRFVSLVLFTSRSLSSRICHQSNESAWLPCGLYIVTNYSQKLLLRAAAVAIGALEREGSEILEPRDAGGVQGSAGEEASAADPSLQSRDECWSQQSTPRLTGASPIASRSPSVSSSCHLSGMDPAFKRQL